MNNFVCLCVGKLDMEEKITIKMDKINKDELTYLKKGIKKKL